MIWYVHRRESGTIYIKFLLEEENKWKKNSFAPLSLLFHHCTAIIFDFQNAVTVFFFRIFFFFESSTFNLFIYILFQIIIVCKCYTTFHVLLLFFNGRWICAFSLCPRVSVFSKNLAVFTLINQLMQMLPSRDFLSNECSRNVQKVVEKLFLWVNSFLTEMQFFSVQLDFHRENKIHRCLSRIFLKHLRNNYFAGQLLMAITLHGLSGLCAYIVL